MRSTFLLALLLVAACGDSTNSTDSYSMTGAWTLTISLRGIETRPNSPDQLPWTCGDALAASVTEGRATTATLVDEGGSVVGTNAGMLSCYWSASGGGAQIDWSGPITGSRRGNSVRMDAVNTDAMLRGPGLCSFTGTMTAETAANGTVVCDAANSGYELHLSGTWSAARN